MTSEQTHPPEGTKTERSHYHREWSRYVPMDRTNDRLYVKIEERRADGPDRTLASGHPVVEDCKVLCVDDDDVYTDEEASDALSGFLEEHLMTNPVKSADAERIVFSEPDVEDYDTVIYYLDWVPVDHESTRGTILMTPQSQDTDEQNPTTAEQAAELEAGDVLYPVDGYGADILAAADIIQNSKGTAKVGSRKYAVYKMPDRRYALIARQTDGKQILENSGRGPPLAAPVHTIVRIGDRVKALALVDYGDGTEEHTDFDAAEFLFEWAHYGIQYGSDQFTVELLEKEPFENGDNFLEAAARVSGSDSYITARMKFIDSEDG